MNLNKCRHLNKPSPYQDIQLDTTYLQLIFVPLHIKYRNLVIVQGVYPLLPFVILELFYELQIAYSTDSTP